MSQTSPREDESKLNKETVDHSGTNSNHSQPSNTNGSTSDAASTEEVFLKHSYSQEQSSATPDEDDDDNKPVWKNRNFLLLWIAQALSQTAQHTLNLTLVVYVNELTNGSPTQTAIVTVCFLLPGVFFSALAGVFVDRFRKRSSMLVTNLARALIVPWLFFMSSLPLGIALPAIYVITIVFSTISQFFNPAEAAAIPLLVKPSQLTRANALFQITLFATLFLGNALLGPLLPGIIGAKNVFLVIFVLYVICVGLVYFLPHNEHIEGSEKAETFWEVAKSIFSDLKEGWHFIRSDSQVWVSIVYLSTVQTVLFTMTAIGIPYVGEKGLHQPSNTIIFVLAPLSIGLGISVGLINKLITPGNRLRMMVLSCAAMGIIMASVGLIKPIADLWVLIFTPGVPIGGPGLILLMIVMSLPFGFSIGLLNVPALTILQERSPKDLVGRVFAAYFTFANAVSIVPILFAGALGDIFGAILGQAYAIVPVFFLFGGAVFLVSFYASHYTQKRPKA